MLQKYFVSATGDDVNDGLTWNNAKATIVDALASSTSGDMIIVGPGVFDAGQEIVINKGVTIKSFQGVGKTTLTRSGQNTYRIMSIVHPFAKVQGFTISNGKSVDGEEGGNVFVGNGGVLLDCTVTNGSSWQYGGNVYMEQGTVNRCDISNGIIRQVGSGCGGGVYVRNNSIVESCYVHHNAAAAGGGICVHQPTAVPRVNTHTVVRNCTATHNTTTGWANIHGGGIAVVYEGSVTNCISWANVPNDAAFVFLTAGVAETQSYNNIGVQQVFNGVAPTGIGNINLDPMLQQNGSIGVGSPCIGAGANSKEIKDIQGNVRVNVINPDLGAFVYM